MSLKGEREQEVASHGTGSLVAPHERGPLAASNIVGASVTSVAMVLDRDAMTYFAMVSIVVLRNAYQVEHMSLEDVVFFVMVN